MSRDVSEESRLSEPCPLAASDETETFASGVEPLDMWLRRRALHNNIEGGSRTFVVCCGQRVVGYYSLAAGSVLAAVATGRVRRNMPDPVPVALLGRLAVDRAWQRRGLGPDLLRDAVLRATSAGEAIGVGAILVHAISSDAKAFYERFGFRASTIEPLTLMIRLSEAAATFSRTAPRPT